MPRYHANRLLPFSREDMFALVADVEAYPQFLPWWTRARVVSRDGLVYRTDQSLGLGPVALRFPSETRLMPPERIEVRAHHGPVRELSLIWRFEARPVGCLVRLDMTLMLASAPLNALVARLHQEAATSMIAAFERRARAVYRPHGRIESASP